MNITTNRTPSIFITWLPLAVMWIVMAGEQPVITSVIARMNDATRQLAAFGIAFSLALFIESSIIQMLASSTALAYNLENYKRLLTMMHIIGWLATAVHGILCIPVVFNSFATVILGIPKELIIPSRKTFLAMLPWTIAVGYRRLWQGVLIRYGYTKIIPLTTAIRILMIIVILWWAYTTRSISGATAGGLGLSIGVIGSALITWFYTRPIINKMPSVQSSAGESVITWNALIMFYIPLALTNFMNFGIRPVIQMGMVRGSYSLESLAIWPVFIGYIFLFRSLSLASQEVVIARFDGLASRRKIIQFSSLLAIVLSVVYFMILVTPLWRIWYSDISNLKDNLTALSRFPIILAFPMIPLSAFISLFRGALIRHRRTREVTYGIIVNVTFLAGTLFTGVAFLPYPAISIAAVSYSLAFAAEFLFLLLRKPLECGNT